MRGEEGRTSAFLALPAGAVYDKSGNIPRTAGADHRVALHRR